MRASDDGAPTRPRFVNTTLGVYWARLTTLLDSASVGASTIHSAVDPLPE